MSSLIFYNSMTSNQFKSIVFQQGVRIDLLQGFHLTAYTRIANPIPY